MWASTMAIAPRSFVTCSARSRSRMRSLRWDSEYMAFSTGASAGDSFFVSRAISAHEDRRRWPNSRRDEIALSWEGDRAEEGIVSDLARDEASGGGPGAPKRRENSS